MNRPIEIHDDAVILTQAEKLALAIRVLQILYAVPSAALPALIYLAYATALGINAPLAERIATLDPQLLSEFQARVVFEGDDDEDPTKH